MTATVSYSGCLRRLRGPIAAVGLLSALVNVLMLTGSIYMLQVYDRVLASGSVPTLLGLFAVVVIAYGFLALYDVLRGRLLARSAMWLDVELAPRAFTRSFDDDGGAVQARPLRDIETVRGFLSGPAVIALLDLPWVPLFLGVLFLLHPWLGWLTVAGAAVGAVLAIVTRGLSRRPIERATLLDAADRDFVEQGRGGSEAIRAMGMTGAVTAVWLQRRTASLAMQQAAAAPSELLGPPARAFRMLLQSAILTLGAYLVLRHELSAGMIIASSILSGRALAPIDQVVGQWRVIGKAIESHARLRDTFPDEPPGPAPLDLPPPTGRIVVQRVTRFAPGRPGTDRPRMLTQVTFDLASGDGLGVIGPSASGKSTLARLLVGAIRPDAGEIRFDGATRDQWRPEEIGRAIGYLPQQIRMLPGTIAENIARFDPEAEDADVIAAARLTGVHDMILSMPDGYATRLGHQVEALSGGQLQRIGLARAVYRMPKIVVLDEPNSNLDAAGDEALATTIVTLRKAGSVVVVMSHRPSGLVAVNKVMVLKHGVVSAFGDKAEVLRAALGPQQVGRSAAPAQVTGPVAAQGAGRADGRTEPPAAGPAAAAPQPAPEAPQSAPEAPRQDTRTGDAAAADRTPAAPVPPVPAAPPVPAPVAASAPAPVATAPTAPAPSGDDETATAPADPAPRPEPKAGRDGMPGGARIKILRAGSKKRDGGLRMPERGTSVWPPMPPMPTVDGAAGKPSKDRVVTLPRSAGDGPST